MRITVSESYFEYCDGIYKRRKRVKLADIETVRAEGLDSGLRRIIYIIPKDKNCPVIVINGNEYRVQEMRDFYQYLENATLKR